MKVFTVNGAIHYYGSPPQTRFLTLSITASSFAEAEERFNAVAVMIALNLHEGNYSNIEIETIQYRDLEPFHYT